MIVFQGGRGGRRMEKENARKNEREKKLFFRAKEET